MSLTYQEQQLLNTVSEQCRHLIARVEKLEKQLAELKGNNDGNRS